MFYTEVVEEPVNYTPIILITIGVVVLLIAAAILLTIFVFIPNKTKREIRDLDRRFQYLHSLLIGQDAQCIKRLEIVSRTNLLYVDIHTRYLKKFKEVRDKHDANAQGAINHLKDLVDEKNTKMMKESIQETREIIAAYEKEVNALTNDLLKVIKPEEDCRQASLSLKENLRRIKQEYYAKEGDLQLVKESFDVIFNHVESLFIEFENYVESAQYDDANAILPKIVAILKQVSTALEELPNLCALVTVVVPDKISSLENAYDVMKRDNYPLDHLVTSHTFKEMRRKVDNYTTKIKQFDLTGVSTALDDMQANIDEYFRLFNEEKEAREKFETQNIEIYRFENSIERRFIKLCNNVPEVAKFYIINEQHRTDLDQIQIDVDRMGNFKRIFDTYMNTKPAQPFSVLVKKMDELNECAQAVTKQMDDFNDYLLSLKNDSQDAYLAIKALYFKAKEAEEILRQIDNEVISNKYQEPIDNIYNLINVINAILYTAPIDVDELNEKVGELAELGNKYLGDGGEIMQDRNMQLLAENAIVYANRSRKDFSDIAQLIEQVEIQFNNGDFENAYVAAGSILKKIQSKADA